MLLALALLVPWAAGAVLLVLDGRRRSTAWVGVGVLGANTAVLGVLTAVVLDRGTQQVVAGGWPAGVGIVLRADALGVVFALVSALVLLAATAAAACTPTRERTFTGLVLLLATGLNGVFLTGDVFNFYVFFELAMMASYALTASSGGRRPVRAALVFAAVNLLGSFVFLLSITGTYRTTGTLAMADVATGIAGVGPNAAVLVATGYFIAFAVKLGIFPFHFWLPTVYAGTSPAVAAILSGAVANIGGYGLLRFGVELFPAQVALASGVLVVLGAASVVYGGVLAVSRGDAAEMLAYSAIGQVGYVLVAIGIGGPLGLAAAVLYSVVNALNKGLLFVANGLRGPLVAAAFAVGALSVAGIPPAAGFVGKLALFRAGVADGSWALVLLFTVGSALSLLYAFQVYQGDFWRGDRRGPTSPRSLRVLAAAVALVVLALGLWPQPLLAVSDAAAAALAGEAG